MDNSLGQVVLVKDINPNVDDGYFYSYSDRPDSSNPRDFIEFDGKLYFHADDGENGDELWVSDGTREGTQLVADINPGLRDNNFPKYSRIEYFIEFNDKLYFSALSAENGQELWVSDGTREGTQLVADINPGLNFFGEAEDSEPGGPNPSPSNSAFSAGFIEFNNKLYFSANDGENGEELWVSDGTREGTQLVADINPGSSNYSNSYSSSYPRNFIEFNNKLYFSANDGDNNQELWVSDGTREGTQLVADINPGSSNYRNGSYPGNFIEFNNKLYFIAFNRENGGGLFVSDGTTEGTQFLVDLDLSAGNLSYYVPNPANFIEFNNKLYFSANDGENGRELFVSDGTAEGTQLLADLNPNSNNFVGFGSYPGNFTEFNNKLYFTANDGENGDGLFVSDGTTEGTQLVAFADVIFNDLSYIISSDSNLVEFKDKLYFLTNNNKELFVTGGTAESTQLVANFDFSVSGFPPELTVVGDELFFVADNGETGEELFKLTFDDTVTSTQPLNPITQTLNNDNLVGTDGDDEIAGDEGNDGITGEGGNDVLDGKSGNDVLNGGAGSDTLDGGAGTDTTVYQFAPAAVTVSLGEGEALGTAMDGYGSTDSLANLENIIGSEFDDNLTGNSGNNSLTGRGGNDAISGLAGDDFLTGSTGADTISGGSGSDRFVYFNANEGGDTIADFAAGTDKIAIVAAGFGGGLSVGELPQGSFAIGSEATGNEQRFVFDDANGSLFFDADGNGVATPQLIATVDGVSNFSAGDIILL